MPPVGAVGTEDNIGAKGQRDGVGRTSNCRRATSEPARAFWIRSTNTIWARSHECCISEAGHTTVPRPHVTRCLNSSLHHRGRPHTAIGAESPGRRHRQYSEAGRQAAASETPGRKPSTWTLQCRNRRERKDRTARSAASSRRSGSGTRISERESEECRLRSATGHQRCIVDVGARSARGTKGREARRQAPDPLSLKSFR